MSRCELDYDHGVCLARLDDADNCTRQGGHHNEDGQWVPDALPEQPDGIDPDDYGLPDPTRAAGRVLAFVSEFGDGIVEVATDRAGERFPLYARDLEALAKAVSG